jgi:anti-sigma factor RsiW
VTICDNLNMFADGELSAKEADVFRDHLADCEPCQNELESILVLMARISALPRDPEWRWSWLWMRWEVR